MFEHEAGLGQAPPWHVGTQKPATPTFCEVNAGSVVPVGVVMEVGSRASHIVPAGQRSRMLTTHAGAQNPAPMVGLMAQLQAGDRPVPLPVVHKPSSVRHLL
jgi:hypothetical protein